MDKDIYNAQTEDEKNIKAVGSVMRKVRKNLWIRSSTSPFQKRLNRWFTDFVVENAKILDELANT